MKIFSYALMFLLGVVLGGLIVPTRLACAADWSTGDTVREVIAEGLIATDFAQTRTIAANPQQWSELNPLLGSHPSVGKVNLLAVGVLIAHPVISYLLPRPYREVFQYVTIGVEATAVSHNYQIGIHTSW